MKLALLLLLFLPTIPCSAVDDKAAETTAPAPKPAKRPQFLIVLRLVPRLHDDRAWTDADKAAVGAHFRRLLEAEKTGDVILAGRTSEPGDRTLGLIVFEASDEAAARKFMEGDPCIVGGQMTGELRPYSVAILRK